MKSISLFLFIIYNIEKLHINNRLIKTNQTLIKKSKKVGRKIGSNKVKSKFDKHKKFIFEELNKKTPKVKILTKIKQKDSLLGNITIQALGQYIKKQEELNKTKKQLEMGNDFQSFGKLIKKDGWLQHEKN